MRLAIVTPYYFPSVRGNSITVQRIESGLRDQGLMVRVWSLEQAPSADSILGALDEYRPDLVHGFHATASGPLVIRAARAHGVPAIVSVTGTDANADLFEPGQRDVVLGVLRQATRIVVFHEVMRTKVAGEVPEAADRIRVIGQTVRCHEVPFDFRGRLGFAPDDLIFFIPAGIRRVKHVTFCLAPLEALRLRYPQIRAVFVGPVIEAEEGVRLRRALDERPWAVYLGPVAHEVLCAMLNSVDVVVNSSLSEGGMANAILEAMSRGRAVLVSDIEGNRTVVRDGIDGFVFGSETEFIEKAERLIREPSLRRELGTRARQKIDREFSREGEIQEYLHLYEEAIGAAARR
jgi:glycosyltransferase involved in cell wall biosynthesis